MESEPGVRGDDVRSRRTRRRAAYVTAVLAPPAVMALLIHWYGVNLPFSDEWDILGLVLRAYRGQLDVASIWAQHNEHRLVLVNVLSIVLAKWTDYNLVANMYCGFAFQALSLLLVWQLLRLTIGASDPALVRPLTVVASCLLFWTAACETWIWAIASVQFLSSVFWAVATVWAMARWPAEWRGWLAACAFAALGVLNSATGFPLLAIVGLGTLAYGWRRRRTLWAQLALLGVVSAVLLGVFFSGWRFPNALAGETAPTGLLDRFEYFLVYLGSPFQSPLDWRLGLLMGATGLIVLAVALRSWRRRAAADIATIAPWVLLIVYVLANGVLTAYGRAALGPAQAMATRYAAIATPFWLALVVLTAVPMRRLVRESARPRVAVRAAFVGAALMGAAYIGVYADTLVRMQRHARFMHQSLRYVRRYETSSDAMLAPLFPDPSRVRALARELDERHLGPFAR